MDSKRQVRVVAAAIVVALAGGVAVAVTKHFAAIDAVGNSIGVFDVVVDKHKRAFVDIVFDRPVAVATAGEIVSPPPASISPEVSGIWRWHRQNVLRFEPAGGFSIGTTYTISLNTKRLTGPDERFRGSDSLTVTIKQLMVEKIVTSEESLPDRTRVRVKGEITFNYPVDDAMVATHATLIDGNDVQPIEVLQSTDYGRVVAFRTQPLAKSERERSVKLVLAKGLAERGRGSALTADSVTEIKLGSSDHLAVRALQPLSGDRESTLRLELSSAVNPDVVAKFITITPAVKFHTSAQGNELFFAGDFAPGTTYQLTLAKGLPAVDDAKLDRDYSAPVTFPDLEQRLDFQSEGMFLSATGYKTLAIESTNVPDALIAVDRVYRNNIFHELVDEYPYEYSSEEYEGGDDDDGNNERIAVGAVPHKLGDALVRQKIKLRNVHNKKAITTVSLDPFIKAHEPGLYRVVLAGRAPLQQIGRAHV